MKYSIVSAAATMMVLLPAFGTAGRVKRQTTTPTANDLAVNVAAWQADTQAVSSFLNNAASFTDDAAFRAAALVALNAEMDEINHKNIIDLVFNQFPVIQNANNVLVTLGTFQTVVNGLTDLVMNGMADIGTIPTLNANRCFNVLPAIDAYFSTVENALTTSPQGLTLAVPVGGAVRPTACIPPGTK